MNPNSVSVTSLDATYPLVPPFDAPNPVYDAVCLTLRRLFGTGKKSNPLNKLAKPGYHVVIKPNFVANRDRNIRLDDQHLRASSTHPSVLRPVLDMVIDALDGQGTISIVDSPIEGSDIRDTVKRLGFDAMLDHLAKKSSVKLEFLDLRDFTFKRRMVTENLNVGPGKINIGFLQKVPLPGDPRGYTVVDLGAQSCLEEFADLNRLAFHRSRPTEPRKQHRRGRHPYSIANTVLSADLIINLPKMKTHKKAGATLSMKSTVGLTNRKIWLPHFRSGYPPLGDEFEAPLTPTDWLLWKLSRFPLPGDHSLIANIAIRNKKEIVMDGSWQGNDTLWRTIFDLVRAVLYTDKKGCLQDTIQRPCLTLVDGIVAGEGDGPIRPKPKNAGLLVAGMGMAAVDAACLHLMGLPPEIINTVSQAKRFFGQDLGTSKPHQIDWLPQKNRKINRSFKPPSSWPGLGNRDKGPSDL